jgi:hypothetical protein
MAGARQEAILPVEISAQRLCTECEEEEMLQPRREGSGDTDTTAATTRAGQVLSQPGQPLPSPTRRQMEQRFGTSFDDVRVHDDARAAESAEALSASAYTLGSHLVFNRGRYRPERPEGWHLLAHELTHVLQQRGSNADQAQPSLLQRDSQLGPPIIGPLLTGAFSSAVDLACWTIGRSLSSTEIGVLRPVYGIHLNYDAICICESSVCSPDGTARTIGNVIATPASGISNSTLIHEAAHAWQHQNGIPYAYISSALLAQFGSWLITGSRSGAYDWRSYYSAGVPWAAWNAEAQASYIQHHRALPPFYVWSLARGMLPVP